MKTPSKKGPLRRVSSDEADFPNTANIEHLGPTAVASEGVDVDPVAEADVYIAYGRFKEAKDILEEAFHSPPLRADVAEKLIEVNKRLGALNEAAALEQILRQINFDTTIQSPADEPASKAATHENRLGTRASQGPTRVERLATKDALERRSITKALVHLISQRTSVEPLAVGLFGHWGSGKSSQIDFVRKDLGGLTQPSIRVAEFNAWYHEKTDNLGAALAQTIVETLVRDLGFFDQVKLAIRLALRRKSRLTRSLSQDANNFSAKAYLYANIFGPLLGPCIGVGLVVFLILANLDWQGAGGILAWSGSLGAGVAALWVGWHKFVADNLTQWFKRLNVHEQSGVRLFSLPDFSTKLGSFHDIHTILKHLCSLRLRGSDTAPTEGEYLLLVVDDLDRCTPQAVKQVFDAVRLVANIPRVVTLVAIDERIAFAAVEKHYDQFGFAGREPAQVARDYLAKVFQVAITLPPVSAEVSGQFIRNELFGEEMKNTSFATPTAVMDAAQNASEVQSNQKSMEDDDAELHKRAHHLLSALPDEVQLFASLAEKTRISNPRELWRLKQAWYLLKGLVLRDGDGIEEMEPWMRSLFVREWVLQASFEARDRVDNWLDSRGMGKPLPDLDPVELDVMSLEADNFSMHRPFVDVVLLPAAPLNQRGSLTDLKFASRE